MDTSNELRDQIVRLIVASGEGGFTATDLEGAGGGLDAVGYTSLSYMRLIDAIENETGVYLDPEADAANFATVDAIVGLVRESGSATDG
ncbi:hypothetical protein R8Z50_13075 [Longispora sp. K20-0274]|uniref:hypothetical protein n=1 Tax=Longispora sp. K20-0274 TaxID=3088255 RepID=UPI00399A8875